jgi:hypothetical protein
MSANTTNMAFRGVPIFIRMADGLKMLTISWASLLHVWQQFRGNAKFML